MITRRPVAQAVKTLRGVITHPGNRGRRGRAVVRYLGWQIWQRVVSRPLAIRFEGLKLVCFPHEQFSSSVLYNGFTEWEEMHFIKAYLRPGDVFVDVGANVGVYTLLAASLTDVKVYAFEPVARTYERLAANVKRNRLSDRVTASRTAVGAIDGVVTVTNTLGPMNRVAGPGEESESVAIVRLDGIVTDPPALIKIDVEGYELSVLQGAIDLLKQHHPALVVEANDRLGLREFLGPLGYQFYEFDPETRAVRAALKTSAPNVIALAGLDMARDRLPG